MKKCCVCSSPTIGKELFLEQWSLCDLCATKAMRLAGRVRCHDCGGLTYGVQESDSSYDICVLCLSRRQLEKGMIDAETFETRFVLRDVFEWHGRMGRFLDVLERLTGEQE